MSQQSSKGCTVHTHSTQHTALLSVRVVVCWPTAVVSPHSAAPWQDGCNQHHHTDCKVTCTTQLKWLKQSDALDSPTHLHFIKA